VIFATCGSSHIPFERMMRALAELPGDEMEIQHGPATPPACARAVAFLPFDQVVRRIERAEVVVSHAGVGSILCAVRAGHTPVIFPRLRRYSETVDDHQAELAEALAESGIVIVAEGPEDLAAAVASVPGRRSSNTGSPGGAQELNAAVHAAIRDKSSRRFSILRRRALRSA